MRKIESIICLWVLLTAAYFIQGGSWRINAILDLTRAVVELGTLDCSAFSYNSGDLIQLNGKVIPLKAPGLSFMGIPMWSVLHGAGFAGDKATTRRLNLSAYFVNLSVSAVFLAWAALWFFRFCLVMCSGSLVPAAYATVVAFSGTLLLPVGTLLLGHVTAASLCWVSFARAILLPPKRMRDAAIIGFLLGVALTIEYLALPTIIAIGALTVTRSSGKTRFGLVLGFLPLLVALSVYHWALLGAPWRLPYTIEVSGFTTEGAFAGLFLRPSFHVIWQTTLGSYRGVFFSSPILIIGCVGLYFAHKRNKPWRIGAVISLIVVIYHFAFIWCFNGWHGGWTMGSRYFVTAVFFISWPLALMIERCRILFHILAVISIGLMLLAATINPQIPDGIPDKAFPDPWFDYIFPAVLSGEVADQVQSVDEKWPRYEWWPRGREYMRLARQKQDFNLIDPSTGKTIILRPDDSDPKTRRLYHELQKKLDTDLETINQRFPPEFFNPRHPNAPAGVTNWGLLLGFTGVYSLIPLFFLWSLLVLWFWTSIKTAKGSATQ